MSQTATPTCGGEQAPRGGCSGRPPPPPAPGPSGCLPRAPASCSWPLRPRVMAAPLVLVSLLAPVPFLALPAFDFATTGVRGLPQGHVRLHSLQLHRLCRRPPADLRPLTWRAPRRASGPDTCPGGRSIQGHRFHLTRVASSTKRGGEKQTGVSPSLLIPSNPSGLGGRGTLPSHMMTKKASVR